MIRWMNPIYFLGDSHISSAALSFTALSSIHFRDWLRRCLSRAVPLRLFQNSMAVVFDSSQVCPLKSSCTTLLI